MEVFRTFGGYDAGSRNASFMGETVMVAIKVGSEFLVNTQTANNQNEPTITSLDNGGFVVCWTDGSTLGDSNIKAQIFNADGTKLGTEFLANTQTANYQQSPTITSLNNGGFVVSWTDFSGTLGDANNGSIKAQIFATDGTKVSSEFLVNTYTANTQVEATVTGLTNGGFVVSWRDYSGTLGDTDNGSIKAQIFATDGTKIGSEFLVNTYTAGKQYEPTITGLADGGFVVSWYDDSGVTSRELKIRAQVFDAGGAKIGSELLVNPLLTVDQYKPTVTGLLNGGFVLSWQVNATETRAQIFAADGTKIGSELFVNTHTQGSQNLPTITGLADGGFVVSWQDSSNTLGDSDGFSIKAQIFSVNGAKVGTEFLVNTQTASNQYGPTITSLANGGFVVSWQDSSNTLGDASGLSIKAQIFSVQSSNSAPAILSNGGGDTAAISIAENGLGVTIVAADDVDGDILTYAIAGGADAALFQIDDATGALAFLAAPDFEAPADAGGDNIYDVMVSASDGTNSDTQILAVSVTNLIEGNTITGTESNDAISTKKAPVGELKATALDDLIFGNGGNDTIDGGAGADQMHGGLGNDVFLFDNAGDQAIELFGEGTDTMKSSVVDMTLAANIEKGTLLDVQGIGADLDITGNDLANTLTGNRGANALAGGDGKDVLNGKDGNDTLSGDAGDDKLNGNNGDDILIGGAGIDFLTGGAGSDTLTGGSEADQFKFDKFMLADGLLATDTIADFSGFGGEGDRINLGAIDANGNALDGNQKFAFIGTAAFSGVAGQLRYQQSGGDTLLSGDINGDSQADFQIIASGLHSFVTADFIL